MANGTAHRNGARMPVAMFRGGRQAAHASAQDGDIIVTQNSSSSDNEDVKPTLAKRKINRKSVRILVYSVPVWKTK